MAGTIINMSEIAEHDGRLDPGRYVGMEYVVSDKFYPLMDWHQDKRKLRLRAKATRRFRRPRKGEWYLSGEGAYCAPNDLTRRFTIARLFATETRRVVTGRAI